MEQLEPFPSLSNQKFILTNTKSSFVIHAEPARRIALSDSVTFTDLSHSSSTHQQLAVRIWKFDSIQLFEGRIDKRRLKNHLCC